MYINLALLGFFLLDNVAAAVIQPPQLEKQVGITLPKTVVSKSKISISTKVLASEPHKTSKSTHPAASKITETLNPQSKKTWGDLPRPDPADLGPHSRWIWKGPYGPQFDITNGDSMRSEVGNRIDPSQKELWDKQHNKHPDTDRDDHAKRDEATQSQVKDSVEFSPTQDDEAQAKNILPSRSVSLVKRIVIGGSMPGVILHPPHPTPSGGPIGNVPFVYNGQPGMIYLKGKTEPTYCNDSSHTIGQNHVYLPSIYFTDVHERSRCDQPAFLFWVSGRGHDGQGGKANFQTVVVAGRCEDCYPWEIQAENAVIEAIIPNLSGVAGSGLWGPTLALGTSDNIA